MIPILYDKTETAFASNGLGRLRDCISCVVTEERNGIYECDFEYPVTGANYDQIQLGRVVGVVTDDTGDFQPFDIVSFTKPIDGVVTFHCVHISYRQSYMTVTGSGTSSLSDAFDLLATAEPSNPFTYWTDMSSSNYMAAADGKPHSVRQLLGGVEGSILDAYGGEYEWDKFMVKLWSARGQARNFTIRYGVNMLTYDDDTDSQGTYSSCVPFWSDSETTVVGNRVDSYGSTVTGRGECVPLDLSDKFETEPTTAQLESMAASIMNGKNTYLPTQTIKVSFIRLQDMDEYENLSSLLQCGLCDTIKVIFPDYGTSGQFKIVKTVWDVLMDRYESMELGTLSTTLSEALGITNGLGGGSSTESGNVFKTLLWTNNNPSANFPTTTLLSGQDLTVYDGIEVIGINYTGYESIMPPLYVPIGSKGNLIGLAGSTGDSAGIGFLVMRGISANANGIVVHGAVGAATNGSAWSANDNNMVPVWIYGVKYY